MRTEITKLGEVVSRSCGRRAASVCISVAIQRERLLFRQYRCCCRRDRRHRHRHRRWRWYTFLEKFMSSTIPFCRFFLLCITNETEWKKNKKKKRIRDVSCTTVRLLPRSRDCIKWDNESERERSTELDEICGELKRLRCTVKCAYLTCSSLCNYTYT